MLQVCIDTIICDKRNGRAVLDSDVSTSFVVKKKMVGYICE